MHLEEKKPISRCDIRGIVQKFTLSEALLNVLWQLTDYYKGSSLLVEK